MRLAGLFFAGIDDIEQPAGFTADGQREQPNGNLGEQMADRETERPDFPPGRNAGFFQDFRRGVVCHAKEGRWANGAMRD